ncbi:MAG: hypothetical protein ABJZ55_12090 [Fuerstiella sp.]
MSLQTLVGISTSSSSLAKTVVRIHAQLSDCPSVKGLYSVQRLSGNSYSHLERSSILSAIEGEYFETSALDRVAQEMDDCSQGLEARWEVERFRRVGSRIVTWTHYLSFLYEPAALRSSVLAGLDDVYFIDAGSQQHYLPTRMKDDIAAEAAALNLELLVEEIGAIAAVPVKRLSGLPLHRIDPEVPTSRSTLWLFFDGAAHSQSSDDVGVQPTNAGPLYYSCSGPLGSLAGLDLDGIL